MKSEDICRLCLAVPPVVHNLFNDNFPNIIETLTSLKIDAYDELPKSSCSECLENLRFVEKIKRRIIESEKKLRSLFSLNGNFAELINNSVIVANNETHRPPILIKKDQKSLSDNERTAEDIFESRAGDTKVEHSVLFKSRKSAISYRKRGRPKKISTNCKKNNDTVQCYTKIQCQYEQLAISKLESNTSGIDVKDNKVKISDEDVTVDIIYKKNSKKPYEYHCTICKVDFKGQKLLIYHKNKHFKKTCKICGTTTKFDNFRKHMRNQHKKVITESIINAKTDSESKRKQKPKRQGVYTNTEGIIYTVNNKRPFTYHCNICDVDFIGQKLLSLHKNKHYRKSCEICGITTSYGNFSKHMRNHLAGQQICDVCGSIHKSLEGLRTHIFHLHNDKKKLYSCNKCGETFKYSVNLQHHQRKIHTGFRPHICDTCGKRFFTLKQMKRHFNSVHLKLRNNICDYCKRGFSSRYALKVHTRQHTNETPYVCEICAEGFRQPVSLKTHMKSKHAIQLSKIKEEDEDENTI